MNNPLSPRKSPPRHPSRSIPVADKLGILGATEIDVDFSVRTIQEMRDMAVGLSGVPEKPEFEDRVVALIEWRDGTVMDAVRQLKPKA